MCTAVTGAHELAPGKREDFKQAFKVGGKAGSWGQRRVIDRISGEGSGDLSLVLLKNFNNPIPISTDLATAILPCSFLSHEAGPRYFAHHHICSAV